MRAIKAYAKINLSLDIVGKRADGYHLLESVFQTISLYDIVQLEVDSSGAITVTADKPELSGESNLAYKVATAMKERYALKNGYRILIEKKIPLAAGLAGGSADAAAVIKAINDIEALGLSTAEMIDFALPYGADIPFCVVGGTALVEGIGEKITPIVSQDFYQAILVNPALPLATKEVFARYNSANVQKRPQTAQLISALAKGDLDLLASSAANVLEPVAIELLPQIADIKSRLANLGADYVQMSGSGPSVFALFRSEKVAGEALAEIKKIYPLSFRL